MRFDKMRMIYRGAALLAAVGLTACSEPAPRGEIGVTIGSHLVTPQFVSTPTTEWVSLKVPMTISNVGAAAVKVQPTCMSSVERAEGAAWRRVWSPICALTSHSGFDLQPGETVDVDYMVYASLSGTGDPDWDSPAIEGVYRIRIGFTYSGSGETIPSVESLPFAVHLAGTPQ